MKKEIYRIIKYYNEALHENQGNTGDFIKKINGMFLMLAILTLFPLTYIFWPVSIDNAELTNSVKSFSIYTKSPVRPLPVKINYEVKKAKIGEMLFFETKLSLYDNVSCNTCHNLKTGGTNPDAFKNYQANMDFNLNVPGIFNSSYNSLQFWNGRDYKTDELLNVEHRQEEKSIIKTSEIIRRLKQKENVEDKFNEVFTDGITADNIRIALFEYLKTLITPNSRFDKYLRGELELEKEEKEGYDLFLANGCINCHQGINLGGNMLHYMGVYKNYFAKRANASVEDYGLYNATGWEEDKYKFKVPSLRNVSKTAPYLHDGSIHTLEDTVSIMAEYQLGTRLRDDEIKKIVLFLNTLTGEFNKEKL